MTLYKAHQVRPTSPVFRDKVVGYAKELTVKFYEAKSNRYLPPQVITYFIEAPSKSALTQAVRAEVAKQEAIPGLVSITVATVINTVTKPN